jgi:hypothetical protein
MDAQWAAAAHTHSIPEERAQYLVSLIRSWATLSPHITELELESELKFMIMCEQGGKDRIRLLERLLSRYSKLRSERERRDLQSGILPF